MSWYIADVVVNEERQTITLKMENRDSWGRVSQRQQRTFGRRHFERMMAEAHIVVPNYQVRLP